MITSPDPLPDDLLDLLTLQCLVGQKIVGQGCETPSFDLPLSLSRRLSAAHATATDRRRRADHANRGKEKSAT